MGGGELRGRESLGRGGLRTAELSRGGSGKLRDPVVDELVIGGRPGNGGKPGSGGGDEPRARALRAGIEGRRVGSAARGGTDESASLASLHARSMSD
jgi:hypothetical protein